MSMEFLQVQSQAKIQIQSYFNHCLKINGREYAKNLIVLPDRVIENWAVQNIAALTIEDCKALIRLENRILLVGTGEKLIFPKPEILKWFREQRVGVEWMNTAAACRTFQVLTSENRQVAAALMV